MAKKKENNLSEWTESIRSYGEIQQEIENKLTPNKTIIRYISDYTKVLNDKSGRIEWTSIMAHDGIISFEVAQRIIDFQVQQMLKDIDYLKGYLEG